MTDNIEQQNQSVTSAIQERSLGLDGFNTAEKCRITNSLLPNKGKLISEHTFIVGQSTRKHEKVFCGLYSKDGKFFVNATQYGWLFLYRTHNGTFKKYKKIQVDNVLHRTWRSDCNIFDVAFSPDNKYIAHSAWSKNVYEYSLSKDSMSFKTLSFTPRLERFCIYSITYSNDGRELYGGANDSHIYVYNREYSQQVSRLNANRRMGVNAIASISNNVLCSAGDDALLKIWDRRILTYPRPVGILAGHRGGITHIDSRGDCRYLISNSKDQTIKLWDIRKFSNCIEEPAFYFFLRPFLGWDFTRQAVPEQIRNSNILNFDNSIATYFGHSVLKTFIRSRFSPATTGKRYIYTGDSLGRLIIYDLLSGKVLCQLKGHNNCIRDVSWHPFYPYIITSSWDGKVIKWEYRSDNIYIIDNEKDEFDWQCIIIE